MASTDPCIHELENLVEKQMKSTLYAKFLENCIAKNLVPKGLRLKLTLNIGGNSTERQKAVDDLLSKVSCDICCRVRDFQHSKSLEIGLQMEKIWDDIKKNVNNREMFENDNNIYQLTEKKKDTMVAKHKKKLKSLRNVPAIRSESPGKGKKKKYQSRSMKVTTSKAKSLQIEKTIEIHRSKRKQSHQTIELR